VTSEGSVEQSRGPMDKNRITRPRRSTAKNKIMLKNVDDATISCKFRIQSQTVIRRFSSAVDSDSAISTRL
jgi:hypothetical protein